MVPHHPMTEKRECPRIVVDLPVTIWTAQDTGRVGKIIELSVKGAGIIYSVRPEINARLELCFNLPFEAFSPALRIKGKVIHNYEVLPRAGTPPDYRYVVGVEFLNLEGNERAVLSRFVEEHKILAHYCKS